MKTSNPTPIILCFTILFHFDMEERQVNKKFIDVLIRILVYATIIFVDIAYVVKCVSRY